LNEFYLILTIRSEKPPWILTLYGSPRNLRKGLTDPGLFAIAEEVANLLSKGIGWLSWRQVKDILAIVREEFKTKVEKRFVDDLILYLNYKMKEAEHIRNERKQLSLW
jgi:hypothetical protein